MTEDNLDRSVIMQNFSNLKGFLVESQNNINALLHDELGPVLSFKSEKSFIESIFVFMTPFLSKHTKSLPSESIQNISIAFLPVYKALTNIAAFNIATNPKEEKSRLIADLHNSFSVAVEKLLPYASYLQCLLQFEELSAIKTNNVETIKALEDQLTNIIRESNNTVEKHESYMKTALSEANTLLTSISNTDRTARNHLESIQNISAESVISHYDGLFASEAKRSTYWSWGWLVGTILCMGSIVFLGVINPFWAWKFDPSDPHQLYKLLGSKISVMAVLFFFLYWCAKNYMVLQHNITVNRHRQNALGTFEAFVKSAENQDVMIKNALLMQASQCIFNQQPSGYCGPQAETDSHKLLDLLAKTVSSGPKG